MEVLSIALCAVALLLLFYVAIIWYNIRLPYSRNINPKGKYVLVTGAASGIGKGTVDNLLRIGCTKIFAVDINEKLLKENFGSNSKVVCIAIDISNVEQVKDAVRIVANELPSNEKLFGIINCAGILCSRFTPLLNVKEQDMERMFKVNVFGMIHLNKYLFPHLQRPNGVIVNVSSMNGLGMMPLLGVYPATKYAVRGYSEALRRELALLGIRVVSVYPGGVNTPLASQMATQPVDTCEYDFWDSRLWSDPATNIQKDNPMLFMPDEIGLFIANAMFHSGMKRDLILDKLWYFRAMYYSTYALLPNVISDIIYSFPIKLRNKSKQE